MVVEPSQLPYSCLQFQNSDSHGTSTAGRSHANAPLIFAELQLFVNPSDAPLNFRHNGTVGCRVFYQQPNCPQAGGQSPKRRQLGQRPCCPVTRCAPPQSGGVCGAASGSSGQKSALRCGSLHRRAAPRSGTAGAGVALLLAFFDALRVEV